MVAMKQIKLRKLKSTFAKFGLIQESAPGLSRKLLIAQFVGTVIVNTKITANPRPVAVSTFFEQAKNEHIPKK
jgi:hypothetical protein